MSSQDPESSSDYGWKESQAESTPRRSAMHNLVAAIVLIGLVSLLFWLKAVV